MADYKKSFNFSNGLQVDNNNVYVNPNGLVGIGTTVPTNTVDIRGDITVVGLATAEQLDSKTLRISGVSTLSTTTISSATITSGSIGNLSVTAAGIATAVSGVVTYYGDGSKLSNLASTQWSTVGVTTLYVTQNVGVQTDSPKHAFQVGGNPDTQSGVGFNTTGDINATGIITASTFSGNLTGSVTGSVTGDVNSTGISTFTRLKVGDVNINAGIVTATTVSASTVTATSITGTLTGDVVGIATTARGLIGTPNIQVGVLTATVLNANSINVSSTGIVTATKLLHIGTGGTAFSALEGGRIGVGTAVPTSDLQIRKASGTLLEVISNSGASRISVGNSVGVGKSTGLIKYDVSTGNFDIINNDSDGNINFLLNGNGVAGTGKFSWQDGNSFSEVMYLNYNGNFSVSGVTTLASSGGITTTGGPLYVNNNLSVGGTITATNIILPSVISNTNLNNSSGITTVSEISILGSDPKIGLGTNAPIASIDGIGKTAYLGKVAVGYTEQTGDLNTYNLAVSGKLKTSEGIFAPSFDFSAPSGILTATGGFVSVAGTYPVQINLYGSVLTFNVVGVGSTSFTLS